MVNDMVIIITMAGSGTRFRNAGYNIPKYMIQAKGKTLFEWSMSSLDGYRDVTSKFIFVVQKADAATEFIHEKCKVLDIEEYEILELDYKTDGQATTCMHAIERCNPYDPILVYNIDTYVEPGVLKSEVINGDGFIPCFNAPGNHWSFVKTDDDGKVSEVREKSRISDNCTLGAYYFSTATLYRDAYSKYYGDESNMENNECYIAPLYNKLIGDNLAVHICIIDHKFVHSLGTPEELKIFCQI